MTPQLINGWYLTTDTHLGTSNNTGVTAEQIHNATNVYNYFSALGWSLSAIAGMLGNMQHESFLSPAYIQNGHRGRLPNSAANLSDVPNSVMLSFYSSSRGYGIGLVQWDGSTKTPPAGQKLVSFAERYSLNWYDGDTQCFRIRREQETNIQWQAATISGTRWTWNNYPTNTQSPEVSADIWRRCYEVGGDSSVQTRRNNARYWYDYFSQSPGPDPPTPPGPGPEPSPEGWISGDEFSNLALAYNGQYLPYSQYDCIGFVNLVWHDIAATYGYNLTNGTNSLWRSNRFFNTISPDGQSPCPELWYKDTIENCINKYGSIPAGALLFHQIGEAGPPPIPSQYKGDGIGNFVHVGIYCGNNNVMQSGGRDSASVPGGGVHLSQYDASAWNYVAFVVFVDCVSGGVSPEPAEPLPGWMISLFSLNKRRMIKNVKYQYSCKL